MTNKMLTVIIPLRVSEDRADASDRLLYQLEDNARPPEVDFLVVDDGSSEKWSNVIKEKCDNNSYDYLYLNTSGSKFNFARCRNEGVTHARTPYVMFLDVDLVPYPGFYQDVLNEIEIRRIHEDASEFLMFGVVYLTKNATNEFFKMQPRLRKQFYTQALFNNDLTRIEKFSTGTSVTVYSRPWYMAHGGNDNDFEGWGFEDLEFNCRMIRLNKKFPLPERFDLDYRNFKEIVEYKGWKSIYRLFGDMTFQKGMVLFHAWHEVDKSSDYMSRSAQNKKIFEKKLSAFARNDVEPDPLPMKENGKSIMFTNTIPFVYNRMTAPYFGEIINLDVERESPQSVVSMVKKGFADRVVFFNPYGSQRMLDIYQAVKENNVPYYVCERGALRDSVFIDPNGFNAESVSYSPAYWDREISAEALEQARAYIENERLTSEALEEQPDRLGASEFRRKNKLVGKKVLFVPLQRPSDTVIKYFCGEIGTYDNFLKLVDQMSQLLPTNWVVLAKKHPLEVEVPGLQNVKWVNDAHVKDLLDVADATLLINSGVGLLSVMAGIKTITAGKAFYSYPGLAVEKYKASDVLDYILSDAGPDKEKVLRFVSYLTSEFYSFGKFHIRSVAWEGGAKMTATTKIDFYQVRVPELGGYNRRNPAEVSVGRESILFDRYRVAMSIVPTQAISPKKDVVLPKNAPAPAANPQQTAIANMEKKVVQNSDDGNVKLAVKSDSEELRNKFQSYESTLKNSVSTISLTSDAESKSMEIVVAEPIDFKNAYPDPVKGSVLKKMRKLIREPKRFFNESERSFAKKIGKMID